MHKLRKADLNVSPRTCSLTWSGWLQVASPDAEQQTVPCTGSDHDVHPLESAIHNSALPEGPDQAARPAKRSRPATPERSAGKLQSVCVLS